MKMTSINSSNIKQIGWEEDVFITMNRKTSVLRIIFDTGNIYDYYQVPRYIYNGLMQAESKGKYFWANIKDKFRYEKRS